MQSSVVVKRTTFRWFIVALRKLLFIRRTSGWITVLSSKWRISRLDRLRSTEKKCLVRSPVLVLMVNGKYFHYFAMFRSSYCIFHCSIDFHRFCWGIDLIVGQTIVHDSDYPVHNTNYFDGKNFDAVYLSLYYLYERFSPLFGVGAG